MAARPRPGSRPHHTPQYRHLCGLLKQWRIDAGLSQRDLAARMKTLPSTVAKSELGQRRIDPVEMVRWCRACKLDPADAIRQVRA